MKNPECACGKQLFWYEVTDSICFDCKSKKLGISKEILLQGVVKK